MLVMVILICTAQCAFAVRVTSIYKAQISVNSQSEHDRSQSLTPGLEQVFIKVSGNGNVSSNEGVREHLKNAASLMQEFSYTNSNNPAKPYLLTLQFDQEGVNKILREAGVPIWGMSRPLILVWAEFEMPAHPALLIDSSSTNDVRKLLQTAADQRGLPLLFPMMDMTDINLVGVNDVVTMAADKLQTAAKRYESDGILILRVFRLQEGFSTQAKLMVGDNQWDLNTSGKTMAEALNALVNNMTDNLAGRYATVVKETVQSRIVLKIKGITEQNDFAQLMHYVEHLTPVADAQITKIDGSDVTLTINLRGTLQSFIEALSIGKKLTPVPTESDDNLKVYQWNH
jgi:hypothetical protein